MCTCAQYLVTTAIYIGGIGCGWDSFVLPFFFVTSRILFRMFYRMMFCATRLEIRIAAEFLCFGLLEIKSIAQKTLHITHIFICHDTQGKRRTSYCISSHPLYICQHRNGTKHLQFHMNTETGKSNAWLSAKLQCKHSWQCMTQPSKEVENCSVVMIMRLHHGQACMLTGSGIVSTLFFCTVLRLLFKHRLYAYIHLSLHTQKAGPFCLYWFGERHQNVQASTV